MQAAGYMGYGVYLNGSERRTLAQMIVSETNYYQSTTEVYDDEESFQNYVEDNFPKLSVYVLDGHNQCFQGQDDKGVLAVYMNERMNWVGSPKVNLDAPSQEAEDEMKAFLQKISSGKSIQFIHWTAIEDN
jgi:hypothetical protein